MTAFKAFIVLAAYFILVGSLLVVGCGGDNDSESPVISFYQPLYELYHVWGNSVVQAEDNGYFAIGTTFHAGDQGEIILVKLAENGTLEWSQEHGDTGRDSGRYVTRTRDGDYVFCGTFSRHVSSGVDQPEVYVAKFDLQGTMLFTKHFSIRATYGYWGNEIQPLDDGGYIVCGGSRYHGENSYGYILKLDSAGTELWSKDTLPGAFSSIKPLDDGGFIAAGVRESNSASHACLTRFDSEGNQIWTREYEPWFFREIQVATDGGFVVIGASGEGDYGLNSIELLRTDAAGNELWQRNLGCGYGLSLKQDQDGGYVVTGNLVLSGILHDPGDLCLIKTDAAGTVQWQKLFDEGRNEIGTSVQQAADGGYVIAGNSATSSSVQTDIGTAILVVVKTNHNGE